MAAYAHHASVLGRRDPEVFAFLHKARPPSWTKPCRRKT